MAAFTLTADLTTPENHWAELVAHPELLFGHNAPDLVAGTDYVARSPFGSGGSGRIEAVQPGRVEFTWGGADWPQPGRFVVYAADDLIVDARAVPDFEAEPTRAHWERMLHIAADFLNTPDRAVDSPVEAVLFDADGVLQWPRPGWLEEMTTLGGPTFVLDAFAAERDCLAGGIELAPLLTGLLTASGTGATVEQVLQVWHDIVVDPDALALVDRLRDSGLIVCLATNQQSLRGAHMRDALALDAHFDRAFYSFEVGHAKPSRSTSGTSSTSSACRPSGWCSSTTRPPTCWPRAWWACAACCTGSRTGPPGWPPTWPGSASATPLWAARTLPTRLVAAERSCDDATHQPHRPGQYRQQRVRVGA